MANPHRPRGTGKGTLTAWQGLENEPPAGLPVTGNQETRRGGLDEGMESGPAEEYEAPPREKTGGPKQKFVSKGIGIKRDNSSQAGSLDSGKVNFPIYRTGPTIETALRERYKPVRERLGKHIKSIVFNFNFAEYLKKDGYELSEEREEQIKNLFQKEIETITDQIIAYLDREYGEGSVKKSVLEGNFPELELFEDELHDLAVCYYDMVSGAGNNNKEKLDLEKYPDDILKSVVETLSRAIIEKELGLKIEFEEAVDAKIKEILQKIESVGRNKLQRSGINLESLDEETRDIQGKGRAGIIKHCLVAFSSESKGKVGETRAKKIAFWTNYFTESAFKHLGGDDLRKAYLKAFPRSFGKIKKDKPARIIALPAEPERMTIEKILVSDELKDIYATIEEYLLGELQKVREVNEQWVGLTEDERAVLKDFLQDQYNEKFISQGSPDSKNAEQIFVNSVLQSIEKKLKRK